VQVFRHRPQWRWTELCRGAVTASNPQGPISVVAEPQGQFVYVLDGNGELESFKVAIKRCHDGVGAP